MSGEDAQDRAKWRRLTRHNDPTYKSGKRCGRRRRRRIQAAYRDGRSSSTSEQVIGVNITAFGRKLTLFSAIPLSRFPAFHLKCPAFFLRISSWEKMRPVRSTQHQVELKQLGNQLPMLGKANSLCEVGNISLQPGTSMILKLCRYFVIQDHHLIVPCICL